MLNFLTRLDSFFDIVSFHIQLVLTISLSPFFYVFLLSIFLTLSLYSQSLSRLPIIFKKFLYARWVPYLCMLSHNNFFSFLPKGQYINRRTVAVVIHFEIDELIYLCIFHNFLNNVHHYGSRDESSKLIFYFLII